MLPLNRQNAFRERYRRRRPGWRPSGEVLEARVRGRLTAGSRVLDLGCGRGGVMELFWPAVGLAVGVDPDRQSLAEHRSRADGGGMALACALAERIPFAPASFDLVIALWVLEHLPAPEAALSEIRRVLRAPGGRFIFLTPNARHPLIWANRVSWVLPAVQRLLVPRLYGRAEADTFRVRYRANTPARLAQLAAGAGFRVEALQAVPDPSYLAFSAPLFELSVLLEAALPAGSGVHLVGELATV